MAADGSFLVPQSDVQAMLNSGCFFAGPGVESVKIGSDYLIYENQDQELIISGPGGTPITPVIMPIVSKTTDYIIDAGDNETQFDNNGALGDINLTLPTWQVGLAFRFVVVAPYVLRVIAVGGTVISLGPGQTSTALSSSGLGSTLDIGTTNASSQWIAKGLTGVWTDA